MRHVFINLLSAWLGGLMQGRHISSTYALLACIRCITIRHVFDNLLCLLWIDAREACLQWPVHQHHASLALCKACIQYFVRPVGLKVYPYCKVVVFAFGCNNTLAPYIHTHIYIQIYTCFTHAMWVVSFVSVYCCRRGADPLLMPWVNISPWPMHSSLLL